MYYQVQVAKTNRVNIAPMIMSIRPLKLASLTILTLLQNFVRFKGEVSVIFIAHELGGIIGDELNAEHIRETNTKYENMNATMTRRHLQRLARSRGLTRWPPAMNIRVGMYMLVLATQHSAIVPSGDGFVSSMLIQYSQQCCRVGLEPAMKHILRGDAHTSKGYRKNGVFLLDPFILKLIRKDGEELLAVPRALPMLVPPLDWTNLDDGGYIFTKSTTQILLITSVHPISPMRPDQG